MRTIYIQTTPCDTFDIRHFQVALVYGQMNEPPGARARVALSGLTVAEYFRDQEGQDVLLFIDNIFRFTQAGSEVRNTTIQANNGLARFTGIAKRVPCKFFVVLVMDVL